MPTLLSIVVQKKDEPEKARKSDRRVTDTRTYRSELAYSFDGTEMRDSLVIIYWS